MSPTCQDCNKVFSTVQMLNYHTENKVCKKEKPAAPICPDCKKEFSSLQRLKYHTERKVCKKEKPTSPICPDCEKSFSTIQMLNYHLERKVCKKEKPVSTAICPDCNKSFCSMQRLNYHLERKVCHKKPILEDKTCHFCKKEFSSGQRLQSHKKICSEHYCGDKEWHKRRCTTDYNLSEVECYDCGDLIERCGCKDKYIEKCIMEKKAIDDWFGQPFFDNIEGRPWEDVDYWEEICPQCKEPRKGNHISLCLYDKSSEEEISADDYDYSWDTSEKDFIKANKDHFKDVAKWLKNRYK